MTLRPKDDDIVQLLLEFDQFETDIETDGEKREQGCHDHKMSVTQGSFSKSSIFKKLIHRIFYSKKLILSGLEMT